MKKGIPPSKDDPRGFATIYQVAKACEIDNNTATKWVKLADFPKKVKGLWPRLDVIQFARAKMAAYAQQQNVKGGDLKAQLILRRCKKLDEEIKLAQIAVVQQQREDELSKIEHEAKRGEWFTVDQVRDFARLVVSAFDEAVEAVSMATRDDKATQAVRDEFDRVRKKLAKKVGEIAK